jgi:plasmid stabilization system protein ParE
MGFSSLPRQARTALAVVGAIAAVAQIGATVAAWPSGLVIPVLRVPFVLESPPRAQGWHQREILDAIGRDRLAAPARGSVPRISVVPNHAYFSVSNFRYYALRDGRTMEFTRAWDDAPVGVDYMILKTGDVGPQWTMAKPRRIDERFATDASLARVFPVLAEFALPDRSTATVRVRRIPPDLDVAPAALAREAQAAFRRWLPAFARDVDGLAVDLGYDDGIRQGRVPRVEIRAGAATVGEFQRRGSGALRVHGLRLVMEDVLLNPFAAHADGRFELLDIGRVRIAQATITADDLRAFLAGQKGTRSTRITLADGFAEFVLEQRGADVSARIRVTPAPDRPFALLADRVRVGGVTIPSLLVDWVVRNLDPSRRIASRLPVPVEIGDVGIAPDAVRIGGAR